MKSFFFTYFTGNSSVFQRPQTVSKTITVTVVASQVAVNTKNSTLVQGQTWTSKDNFESATDADGKAVDLGDVTVTGSVDTSTPGTYDVSYSYIDVYGNRAQQTATVTVTATTATINVAGKTTVVQGSKTAWTPKDSFLSAIDATGADIDWSAVTVTNQVDLTKAGSYPVTYEFTDAYGNTITATTTVEVVASAAAINAQDVTLKVGQNWTSAAGFVSAQDATGQTLMLNQVTVTGNVDTSKAGVYTVTYSYTDIAGNVVTAESKVTVTATTTDNNGGTDNSGDTVDNNNSADNSGDTTDNNSSTDTTDDDDQYKVTVSEDLISNAAAKKQTQTSAKGQNGAATSSKQTVATTKAKKVAVTARPVTAGALVKATKQKSQASEAKTLPQTNDRASRSLTVLGALLISLTGLVSFAGTRRRHVGK